MWTALYYVLLLSTFVASDEKPEFCGKNENARLRDEAAYERAYADCEAAIGYLNDEDLDKIKCIGSCAYHHIGMLDDDGYIIPKKYADYIAIDDESADTFNADAMEKCRDQLISSNKQLSDCDKPWEQTECALDEYDKICN